MSREELQDRMQQAFIGGLLSFTRPPAPIKRVILAKPSLLYTPGESLLRDRYIVTNTLGSAVTSVVQPEAIEQETETAAVTN